MKKLLLLTLIVGMMVTLGSGYAMAYTGPSYYVRGKINGVKYLTGGVGLTERTRMQEMAKTYDVKLVFAEPSGAYLADVQVLIENSSGKNLIRAASNGPWFFAELPKGHYTITVIHAGTTETKTVVVGEAPHVLMYRFNA